MKKFCEIFKKTPPMPRDEQVMQMCREHPDDVPVVMMISQYKGSTSESDKKFLYQLLADIVSDDVMHEVEVYS